ncbi:MAG: adenylate/guanylate cyclase domain-containing protein [Dongiaceae bacterium]
MAEHSVQRRLAAILAADVVGYSRLMELDEVGTLAALKARRRAVLEPAVGRHQGRIFKITGDGVLVEFGSAVNAVQCAIDLQQGMAAANAGQPEGRHIVLRIGVNLGDVMIEGGDVYGDGVNIAARLEALGEPGDVLVSGTIYDYVKNKVDAGFDSLGAQSLKNIGEQVRVYRVSGTPRVSVSASKIATDKPSIAVLPLTNLSGDPSQEYFSDGMTEDIITELSRFHSLLVIARNSSFAFKGRSVKVQEVARELGVAYVVEGSVRKAAARIRIAAQLVDAAAGTHIWAERYDRDLDDLFEIQDEISGSIVASIAPQLMSAELRRAMGKRDSDLDSWDRLMKARWYVAKSTRDANATAQALLAEAIAREPAMGQAYSLLALSHLACMIWSWSDADAALASAAAAARQALGLDGGDAAAHAVLGLTFAFARRYDDGINNLFRAIALNPNLADGHGCLGVVQGLVGDYEASAKSVERACRLSPYDAAKGLWLAGKGIGAFVAGRYDDVIANAGLILREYPVFATAYRQRAAALAALGRLDEARADMATLLQLVPDLTVSQVRIRVPLKDPAAMERWLGALRKAGLPE